jgi:hypothetical protein
LLHEYHVIYSVRYYSRCHVTAVGLGTYYPWIRGYYCTYHCVTIAYSILYSNMYKFVA